MSSSTSSSKPKLFQVKLSLSPLVFWVDVFWVFTFCGFSGFRGEERGNEDQGAASTPTCPLSARPEAFRAGMQPGSALMLPWEADFPLKIDWLFWGRGLEGACESLAANNPAPIHARLPGSFRSWEIHGERTASGAITPSPKGQKSLLHHCLVGTARETTRGHHDFFPGTGEYSGVGRCLRRALTYLRQEQETWPGSARDCWQQETHKPPPAPSPRKANQFSKESLLPRAASAPILAACPPERLQGER